MSPAAGGRYARPSEATLRRLLPRIDILQLEAALSDWLRRQWTPDEALAIDGKTLRGATEVGQQRHLVAALGHTSQVVGAQVEMDSKHNEIPALRELLEQLPIADRVVTADALHTQSETARFLVEAKHADYLFTAKDNQPTLKDDIASLHLEALPPEYVTCDKAHGHLEERRIWTSTALNDYVRFPYVR